MSWYISGSNGIDLQDVLELHWLIPGMLLTIGVMYPCLFPVGYRFKLSKSMTW